MKTHSFDTVLELVEQMPDDEQDILITLVQQRRRERRREEIATHIAQAEEEYANGQVVRGTVDEIMAELRR